MSANAYTAVDVRTLDGSPIPDALRAAFASAYNRFDLGSVSDDGATLHYECDTHFWFDDEADTLASVLGASQVPLEATLEYTDYDALPDDGAAVRSIRIHGRNLSYTESRVSVADVPVPQGLAAKFAAICDLGSDPGWTRQDDMRKCPSCGHAPCAPEDYDLRQNDENPWFALTFTCPECGSAWDAVFEYSGLLDDIEQGSAER